MRPGDLHAPFCTVETARSQYSKPDGDRRLPASSTTLNRTTLVVGK